MPDTSPVVDLEQTEVGSYFVANYPPFSVWSPDAVATDARSALATPAPAETPLGVYLHIPFCRKRCHFCYFRVYTDKNAKEVEQYLDLPRAGVELYARAARAGGAAVQFRLLRRRHAVVSFDQAAQGLVKRVNRDARSWATAEEITFECEPGTITRPKLGAIRGIGVTRLSLGVENFSDRILELNGRAHARRRSTRVYQDAREPRLSADQHRPDRRHAGRDRRATGPSACKRTVDLAARQRHDLPDGAALQHDDQPRPAEARRAVRAIRWPTGRSSGAGWARRSRRSKRAGLHDRQRLHRGEGSGERVSSIAIACGRAPTWWASASRRFGPHQWCAPAERRHLGEVQRGDDKGGSARARAIVRSPEERMIRELVLQLKRGSIRRLFPEQGPGQRARLFPRPVRSLEARPASRPRPARTSLRSPATRFRASTPCGLLPQHTGIAIKALGFGFWLSKILEAHPRILSLEPRAYSLKRDRQSPCPCPCPHPATMSSSSAAARPGRPLPTLLAQQGVTRAAVRAREVPALPHRRVADPGDLLGAQAARTCCPRCSAATSSRSTACSSSTRAGKLSAPFYFWDNKPHECSQTWQVVRSEFDQMMLDNAREHGVDGPRGRARARRPVRGRSRRRRARADRRRTCATCAPRSSSTRAGRAALLQNRFQPARLGSDAEQGRDLDLLEGRLSRHRQATRARRWCCRPRTRQGWFWYIPLHDDIVSVGVVAPFDYLFEGPRPRHEQIYSEESRALPGACKQRVSNATRVTGYFATKDYSYRATRSAGDGWVLVGDAFGVPRSALLVRRAARAAIGRDGRRRDRARGCRRTTVGGAARQVGGRLQPGHRPHAAARLRVLRRLQLRPVRAARIPTSRAR